MGTEMSARKNPYPGYGGGWYNPPTETPVTPPPPDGNPNAPRNPFAPKGQTGPAQPGANPYGYGIQQTAGQLAYQPNRYGLGRGTNTTPQVTPRTPAPVQTGSTTPYNQQFQPSHPVAETRQYYWNPATQSYGLEKPINLTGPDTMWWTNTPYSAVDAYVDTLPQGTRPDQELFFDWLSQQGFSHPSEWHDATYALQQTPAPAGGIGRRGGYGY